MIKTLCASLNSFVELKSNRTFQIASKKVTLWLFTCRLPVFGSGGAGYLRTLWAKTQRSADIVENTGQSGVLGITVITRPDFTLIDS